MRSKKIPDAPGVYLFKRGRRVLYVGKATSLRSRVRSYFTRDVLFSRGPGIVRMTEEARTIAFQKTDSVLEALILESALIKRYKPKYNVKEKDDKSFNYVVITDEDFPRVITVRGHELNLKPSAKGGSAPGGKRYTPKTILGPFPQGGMLKEALKIVRKIFPFRDTCKPCVTLSRPAGCKPCFNRQIGLCPGICTGEISKKEYRDTIRNIKLLFEGKKKIIVRTLTAEMHVAAKRKEFERAGEIKKTLFALKHIQDISLIKHDSVPHNSGVLMRIEAYDVAHMAGRHVVGVMVAVEDGVPDKGGYRKFNIRTARGGDDVGALKEILERRLGHGEWQLPRVIVVDGGKAQVRAAERIFTHYGIGIPVVGVVKNEYHRPKKILGKKEIVSRFERDILLANSESHRFALAFHKKKRRISLI